MLGEYDNQNEKWKFSINCQWNFYVSFEKKNVE